MRKLLWYLVSFFFMLVTAVLITLPYLSNAQSVTRAPPRPRPQMIMSRTINAGLTSATYDSTSLRAVDGAVLITHVTVGVGATASAGTGTVRFRITDGSNNCDCTANCSGGTAPVLSTLTTPVDVACSGSCLFSGVKLAHQITAGCGTTQPSVVTLSAFGIWK